MSSIPAPPTLREAGPSLGERFRGGVARLRPGVPQLVDAGFTVVLVGLALIGFRTTFFGLAWLWVGLAGLVIGLLTAHVGATFRWPGLATGVASAAAYLLLAGPIAVREDLIGGVLPSMTSFRTLVHSAVPGWKELLTALPPVDSEGPYLALPFLFGLVGATLTYGVSRRWSGALLALVAPLALLVASITLGTLTPASYALQGAVFSLAAIGWAALRSNRNRPALQNGAGRTTRSVTTAVLLGVATAGGFLLGPHLPGADDSDRTVLRTGLVPPFDVSRYPSPVAGFRQYTKPNPAGRWDQTLLTVQGLPDGAPIRFATLDSYDGMVWGAGSLANEGDGDQGSGFRKVGSHIASPDAVGEVVQATITVPAGGYDDVWLPTVGDVTGVDFSGGRAETLRRELRFNIDTNTGVLPVKLAAGDRFTITARMPSGTGSLPKQVDLDSGSLVDTQPLTFLEDRVEQWTRSADDPWAQVVAMTKAMRDGAYTDGGAPGTYQNVFLPGHSLARMAMFFKSSQLAGNDEQYAAALALAANRLGIPTRVVLGAIPGAGGAVKGKDVHAWVEVRTTTGAWQTVLPKEFLPDYNKQPDQVIRKSDEKKTGVQVPPPAVQNPPSVLQGPDQAQNATQLHRPQKNDDNPLNPDNWPDWLRWLLFVLGGPVLFVLLVYGVMRLAKAVRRRRRRTAGATSTRVTGGWREIVDTARDLRMPLPAMATRLEQAHALEAHVTGPAAERPSPVVDGAVMGAPAMVVEDTPDPVLERRRALALVSLAESANALVFDVTEPTHEEVAAFWADVDTARKRLRSQGSWWQRLRADFSLKTFRPSGEGMPLIPVPRATSRSARHRPSSGHRPSKGRQPSKGPIATGSRSAPSERKRARRHTKESRRGDT
ncbi:MAG: transglutaminase domain-containing protein [Intrasporangium sp.]|uniref:transglutaminase domain-containing protein n=1 Tax=Intrasporangium sp. TaxID=1925024 RepID=UPI003F81019E